jgi:RNA polymerase sigma-70 factor (ECF subfamily)
MAALRVGDVQGLIAILDPEIVVRADVAGKLSEMRGAETAARSWVSGAAMFAQFEKHMTLALVDGTVGLVIAPKGRLFRVMRFSFDGGRIASAEVITDRARLDALDIAPIE